MYTQYWLPTNIVAIPLAVGGQVQLYDTVAVVVATDPQKTVPSAEVYNTNPLGQT